MDDRPVGDQHTGDGGTPPSGGDSGAPSADGTPAGEGQGGGARKRRRGSRGGRGRGGRPRPDASGAIGDDDGDRDDRDDGDDRDDAAVTGDDAGDGGATAGAGRRRRGEPADGGEAADPTAGAAVAGGDPAPGPARPRRSPSAGGDAGGDGTGSARAKGGGRRGGGAERAPRRRDEAAGGGAELPDPPREGKVRNADVANRALVPRVSGADDGRGAAGDDSSGSDDADAAAGRGDGGQRRKPKRRNGRGGNGGNGGSGGAAGPEDVEVPAERSRLLEGRQRQGKAVGRYLMCVHVKPELIQIAILEGRSLIEYYVSRTSDDAGQIHGNVYLGKVQNVLPGMEAAFVDIGTPKNAVLYRGDVQYDAEDIVEQGNLRIEQLLKPKQQVLCQVTKNPIGAKGARLTQEVSLPGRFVVLIPNSKTYGISKRLPDDERKRLRALLDRVKPAQHGVIVRTAAEGVDTEELERDVLRLLRQWEEIEAAAKKGGAPKLLYREPGMAVRVIREEFNRDYRGVVIDDAALYEDVQQYVEQISPHLADRVQYYDAAAEGLPLFERFHVHEQVHKALDRKVWLPSGGSLIIEHTEALTVIDVNTGRNVGTSNLEETVFHNNLEAAEEIARQLRLRDIGGIIVIDFIDMEVKDHRQQVITTFREALSRDKTRTQVFDISELGLVEMTRKRIGEGLLTSFAGQCPQCDGRGVVIDHSIIE